VAVASDGKLDRLAEVAVAAAKGYCVDCWTTSKVLIASCFVAGLGGSGRLRCCCDGSLGSETGLKARLSIGIQGDCYAAFAKASNWLRVVSSGFFPGYFDFQF